MNRAPIDTELRLHFVAVRASPDSSFTPTATSTRIRHEPNFGRVWYIKGNQDHVEQPVGILYTGRIGIWGRAPIAKRMNIEKFLAVFRCSILWFHVLQGLTEHQTSAVTTETNEASIIALKDSMSQTVQTRVLRSGRRRRLCLLLEMMRRVKLGNFRHRRQSITLPNAVFSRDVRSTQSNSANCRDLRGTIP